MAEGRPLRVAIVGSGPSGMYAAGHLLECAGGTFAGGTLIKRVKAPIEVDVIDRLPTPWGLIRGGVAPDHPDKKKMSRVYDAIAHRPGFRFPGAYVTGRIRRGPRGIIGSNKKCARDCVEALLADAASETLPRHGTLDAIESLAKIAERAPSLIAYGQWQRIDRAEQREGVKLLRPRVKLTRKQELVDVALGSECSGRGLLDTAIST